MRLSIPHVLRGFLLTWGIWLLLYAVPPLYAQTEVPTSPITTPVIRDLTEATATLGVGTVMQVGALVAMLLMIYFGVRPVLGNIGKLTDKLISYLENSDKVIDRNTEGYRGVQQAIGEHTHSIVVHTSKMEMELKAVKEQLKSEREQGVTDVNSHTTEENQETRRVIGELEARVDQALDKLIEVIASVDKRFNYYDDTIKVKLDTLQRELSGIKEAVQNVKQDSSRDLPTFPADASPPAAPETPP